MHPIASIWRLSRYRALAVMIVAMVAGVAGPASARTDDVRISTRGIRLAGSLTLPTSARAPVVLLLLGCGGSRDEEAIATTTDHVYVRLARKLASRRLASLRIDFQGVGDSGGSWSDTTISRQIADATAAVDWLRRDKRVDGRKIMVLGWSQGGLVATAVAARVPGVRALALWNPVTIPARSYSAIFGHDVFAAGALPEGRAAGVGPPGMARDLKPAFFRDILTIDPVAELTRFRGPVFMGVGTADVLVAPQPAMGELMLRYHHGRHTLWVQNMDHDFNVTINASELDRLIDATTAFLVTAGGGR